MDSLNLPSWDNKIEFVEQFVGSPKKAKLRIGRAEKSFKPPQAMEFSGEVIQTGQRFDIVATKVGRRIYIDLKDRRGTVLRQWHNRGPHGNPDATIAESKHKHVPSREFPLRRHHGRDETWAYTTNNFDDNDLFKAILAFCKECSIELEVAQPYLET